jgi:hypothetical protein
MKTEDELKELARQVIKNEVFVGTSKEEIEYAFMLLVTLGANFPDDTVALYGDYKDTMARGINGYPMFHTCGYLTKDEYAVFSSHWKRMHEALSQ